MLQVNQTALAVVPEFEIVFLWLWVCEAISGYSPYFCYKRGLNSFFGACDWIHPEDCRCFRALICRFCPGVADPRSRRMVDPEGVDVAFPNRYSVEFFPDELSF